MVTSGFFYINSKFTILVSRTTLVCNIYFQAFCGVEQFQWEFPCDPTDLTYFRGRIGEQCVEKIFQASVRIHGESAQEKEVVIDTTVQEKNITFFRVDYIIVLA
jgi:hypothetical protein